MSCYKLYKWLWDFWKKLFSLFPESQQFCRKSILLIVTTGHGHNIFVLCSDHFKEKSMKHGKLRWHLHSVSAIYSCVNSQPSLLRTPRIPKRSLRKRKMLESDEF